MKGLTIEELKKSLKSDDNVAFVHIYETCGNYCIEALHHSTSCSLTDAEEFFVDAIMIFRENILDGKLTELSNMKSYIYGICLNLYRQKNRQNQKFVYASDNSVEELFYQEITQDPLTQSIEDEFTNDMMSSCIETLDLLSAKCKEILEDFYFGKMSMEEIASNMNLSNAQVAKTTKSRCYKKWKELINEHYTSSSV